MDILDEVGKHMPEGAEHQANLTEDENGELVQAPWAGGKDIGDMTVEELEESIETSTGEKMDVSEVIKMMNDPDINVMFKETERRRPRVPAKVKKKKKKIAKMSRKANRKKK